ncbi:MAG: hypothetical protein WCK51_10430 [Armatimonadota bacterium]
MKNWKNDDELLNLAFGELSDRDSQALEAKLLGDYSAQKELDLLRTLRSDMIAIRDDIPEMQFSNERLRQAILSSGKPARPAFPWLNWVLGPAALASVAALAFVMTKGSGPKETVFVANNTKPAVENVLPDVEIKVPAGLKEDRVASLTIPPSNLRIDESGPTEVRVERKKGPSKKRIRTRVNSAVLVARREDPKPDLRDVNSGSSAALKASDSATIAPPAAITLASTEAAPIILIDANTDSGVGAPTATEVSNPSNVAIGG